MQKAFFYATFFGCIFFFVTSCGVKGPPLPPLETRPDREPEKLSEAYPLPSPSPSPAPKPTAKKKKKSTS